MIGMEMVQWAITNFCEIKNKSFSVKQKSYNWKKRTTKIKVTGKVNTFSSTKKMTDD